MKFILGKKIEMTQIFRDDKVIPVTKIKAGPCLVIQVKNQDKDGYQAVQIGFSKFKKANQALRGHFKKVGSKDKIDFRYLKEFKFSEAKLKPGDQIKVDIFQVGDKVKISGFSIGRGFQGVVKRHGFHGSPASHGHKDQLRMPGSIGATGPARVFKGKKMPGRMGGNRVTINNLEIIEILPKDNLLLIKGAVPGFRNSLLEIRSV